MNIILKEMKKKLRLIFLTTIILEYALQDNYQLEKKQLQKLFRKSLENKK